MDNRLLLTLLFLVLSWSSTIAQTTVAVTEESGYDDPLVTEDPVLELTLATDDPTYDVSLPVDVTTGAPTGEVTTIRTSTTTSAAPTTVSTTTAASATEPPLVDTTVTLLETPITSDTCGTEHLCGEEPENCNPGNSDNCLFLAAKKKNRENYEFEMSGQSDGYVACTFSPDGDFGRNEITYICANHNGKVKFFTARYSNGKLIKTQLPANSVKGKINGRKIQCSFLATLPLGGLRGDNVAMSLATGAYNPSSEELGDPTYKFQSDIHNLADTSFNPINVITTTTAAATTTATDTTVTILETPITSDTCGTEQLCGEEPEDCNPGNSDKCLFIAAKKKAGENYEIEMSGQSDGYVACTFSPDGDFGRNEITYICANHNGKVKFFTARYNNGKLIKTQLPASSVKGKISQKKIQCSFLATLPVGGLRAEDNVAMSLGTGAYNPNSEELGDPTYTFQSDIHNLADTSSNVINVISTTTTAATTTVASATDSPLVDDNTVALLETPITSDTCGTEHLCGEEPENCNPGNSDNCLFLAAKKKTGQNYEFEMSGQSDGYVACTFSPDGTFGRNEITYICANHNGKVKFFTARYSKGKLIKTQLPANSVKGKINQRKIQCSFLATLPLGGLRGDNVAMSLATGAYNPNSEELGDPTYKFQSDIHNLADTSFNPINVITTTTAAATTTAASATDSPLVVNTTVTILETPITSDTCGTEHLCGEEPEDCNPGNSDNCLFLAAKKKNGENYEFEMSGQSDGYVACTFSPDKDFGNNEITYICANHNGKVKFFTARYSNGKLIKTPLPANSVKGKITQGKIQCSFLATLPVGGLRAKDNVAMSLATGAYNPSSERLGDPTYKFQSDIHNLADTSSTVNNVIATTTPAPATNSPTANPTTSHAVSFHKSVLQALLIILSTMAVLLV